MVFKFRQIQPLNVKTEESVWQQVLFDISNRKPKMSNN